MTNYEKLHSMSQYDMEEFFSNTDKICELCAYYKDRDNCATKPCVYGIKAWLEQESVSTDHGCL